jgi:hypothetical protein
MTALETRIADFTERIAELKQMNQVLMSNAKHEKNAQK